jgi:hypothetical protein
MTTRSVASSMYLPTLRFLIASSPSVVAGRHGRPREAQKETMLRALLGQPGLYAVADVSKYRA